MKEILQSARGQLEPAGVSTIRTPLIYADAKILGLIDNVREKLDKLRLRGFRLSDRHYEQILQELGEL